MIALEAPNTTDYNDAWIETFVAQLKEKLTAGLTKYRADYADYYNRCKRPGSPAMRDPNPTVVLIPILAVYCWLYRRRSRSHWLTLLVPAAILAGWQVFERVSTGALPAGVLSGYFTIYQTLQAKLVNASNDAAVLSHRSAIRLKRLSLPTACSMRARAL